MEFSLLASANFEYVIQKYKIQMTLDEILERYNERHRYFHTPQHLNRIITDITKLEERDHTISNYHDELVLTTIFHDIVYYPWKSDNELQSAKLFKKVFPADSEMSKNVYKNIVNTKKHIGKTEAQEIFNTLDFGELIDHDAHDVHSFIEYEHQIFKEYQFIDVDTYITNRIQFLKSIKNPNPIIPDLINYIKNRKYNIAIYPGSFNPFHIGHMNVLEKAEKLFDKVIVVKAVNPDKNFDASDTPYQLHLLKEQLPDREVIFVEGNIIEKLFVNNPRNPVMIRGLRNGHDLTYEESYLTICKDFHPALRYSLILCDKEYSHVSSSIIRSIGSSSKVGKKYTPPCYTKIS